MPRTRVPALVASATAAALGLTGWAVTAPAAADPPPDPTGSDHGLVRDAEWLDRAPVAVAVTGGVYVGWRMLGLDPEHIAFHVFRDGERITDDPVTGSTNLLDPEGTASSTYRVQLVDGGATRWATEEFGVWDQAHHDIPLQVPDGGVTPTGEEYTYSANDASTADLDGDGELEIVLIWNPSNAKDNSQSGYTGPVYVDAYEMDGTRLWRLDLGRNIRAGAHYTQLMVFDLDSDGRAEVVLKTADGTVDGVGTVIGDPEADWRNEAGYVLDGPEHLTLFDGRSGAALDTIDYVPPRGDVESWGDDYGNRVDRFLAAVAYLDGERPSVVMTRGYYTRAVLAAFDVVDGRLRQRWVFDSDEPGNEAYAGQGNHNLSVADVDGDGRDEIVFGQATIDDDGTGLYSTGLGHGDAMHVGDLVPDHPGIEVFSAHESMSQSGNRGATMRDGATGEILWSIPATSDTGRAAAADIDPRYPGAEGWATGSTVPGETEPWLVAADGERVGDTVPAANFVVQWDGDLLYEIADHVYDADIAAGAPVVSDWDAEAGQQVPILEPDGVLTNNTTKGTPALQADLLGDWREELVYRTEDSSALRVFTTTDVTEHRLRTLMSDPVYRLGVAWQNVAYNQPPHTSYFLGDGMATPPAPAIRYVAAPEEDVTPPRLSTRFDDDARTLRLHAADDGSGVDTLQWRIGSGDWQDYVAPIPVPEAATVRYRAADVAGNDTGEWRRALPGPGRGGVDLGVSTAVRCDGDAAVLAVHVRNDEPVAADVRISTGVGEVVHRRVEAGGTRYETFPLGSAPQTGPVTVAGYTWVEGTASSSAVTAPSTGVSCG